MFSPVHPDSGIEYVRQRTRELRDDDARARRAAAAARGRAPRAATAQRAAGVLLVRLGSRLLHECYPFPEPARG